MYRRKVATQILRLPVWNGGKIDLLPSKMANEEQIWIL